MRRLGAVGSGYTAPITLEQIVSAIANELRLEENDLLGSQARGDATRDSDYDLFVIVPYEGDRIELGARARSSVRYAGVPINVIVYPRSYLEKRSKDDDSLLLDDVLLDGKVIYETQVVADRIRN
jgi:predicted nucleotidyltransferase